FSAPYCTRLPKEPTMTRHLRKASPDGRRPRLLFSAIAAAAIFAAAVAATAQADVTTHVVQPADGTPHLVGPTAPPAPPPHPPAPAPSPPAPSTNSEPASTPSVGTAQGAGSNPAPSDSGSAGNAGWGSGGDPIAADADGALNGNPFHPELGPAFQMAEDF